MSRAARLMLLPTAALLLGGCVAAIAASAAGMAAGGGREREHRNVELMLVTARQACTAHASQYGAVEITGLREAGGNAIVVSGTVTSATAKQSFKCSFVTEITGFDLQPIRSGT